MEIRQDFLPLGDVTGDLRVTDQLALLVDRIDHDGGKEFRAILAKAPALGQEVLFLARDLQGARRRACFAVFGRIEYRKMLAENLSGLVPLDPLRARVPIGHVPGGIQHADRVVGDALDQETEVTLALEEIPLELVCVS